MKQPRRLFDAAKERLGLIAYIIVLHGGIFVIFPAIEYYRRLRGLPPLIQ